MNSIRPPWIALSLIALVAILACFLRGSFAASELLWLDELHTSWSVDGSMGEVAKRAAEGNQTPIFFWLTWISVSILGHSEFSLRTVSIIAGIGTLVVASWFTWRWTHSAIAATMVAWLIAIDVQFIYYGSEARPYALLQFLSVIQVSLFCDAFWKRTSDQEAESRAQWWPDWWLAIISLLLIHTHLTSVWILVAEAIFVATVWFAESAGLLTVRKSNVGRGDFRTRLMSTAILIVVGCLPILVQVTTVFERRGNWQSISSIPQLWSDSWPAMKLLIGLPTICLVFSYVLTKLFGTLKTTNAHVFQLERIAFVLLWALVPIGCVVTLEYFDVAPMALERYTLVGAAGFPIFAGLCLGCLSSKPGKLGLAGLIIAASAVQHPMVETVRQRQVPQLRIENWKLPISEINATPAKSRHPVFLFSNLIEDRDALRNHESRFQAYLSFPVNGLYRLENKNHNVSAGPTLEPTHFSEAQIKSIKEQGGAWAIVRSASRELVEEIGFEVRVRTATELDKQPSEIHVSIMDTPNSPVYLMSVDW